MQKFIKLLGISGFYILCFLPVFLVFWLLGDAPFWEVVGRMVFGYLALMTLIFTSGFLWSSVFGDGPFGVFDAADWILRAISFVIVLASAVTGAYVSFLICREYIYDARYAQIPTFLVVFVLVTGLVFYLSILPYLVMYAIIHIAKNTREI